jgi:hypothetical protein
MNYVWDRNWDQYKDYLPGPPVKVGHIASPDSLELSQIKASPSIILLYLDRKGERKRERGKLTFCLGDGVGYIQEQLASVKGHLIEMPIHFLEDVNM